MEDKELKAYKEKEYIDLFDVINVLSKKKVLIILNGIALSFVIGVYSLFLPDIYKSETIVFTSQDESMQDTLNGIAGFAGLSFLNSRQSQQASIALETIYSLNFLKILDEKYGIIFDLMAVKGWNKNNNNLEIDNSLYDVEKNEWRSKNEKSESLKPSVQESHEKFLSSLEIEMLPENNFFKITFSHFSPEKAKLYLDAIIFEVNKLRQQVDIDESARSIDYLKKEISKEKITEVKVAMSRLIESQAKKTMFASTSPEYILKTLSPSFLPETKFYPYRIFFVVLGFSLGLILSSFYFLFKYFSFSRYSSPKAS